jgi:uncharacterized protein YbjT (DUF2867 family)
MDRLEQPWLNGTMTDRHETLLLAGTGTTGRRVASRLHRLGRPARVVSRRTAPRFDWNEPSTWPAAVDGVDAAYVVYTPDLAFPGAVDAVGELTALATAAGVGRVVLLSGRGEPEAQRAEAALASAAAAAAASWTVVRCSWFAQNFSESFLLPFVLDGEIALPAADVPEPFVDADDIADVVTAALTEDGHAGQVYELTGPAALTFGEVARLLSAASGRPVRYRPVSTDEFVAAAVGAGVSAEAADGLAALFTKILDGRNRDPADGVRHALGRPARSFAQFAADAAATGAWAGR